jgi:hypothetical protein
MDKFIKLYNRNYIKCRRIGEDYFKFQPNVYMECYKRNSDAIKQYFGDNYIDTEEFQYMATSLYLNNKLGIKGLCVPKFVAYNLEDNSIITKKDFS